ncbi:uncharacterized protein LOC133298823 isoform X1 [Gastrolobium bilobum]|uniref:uncharacterized protein LOC133298823 isoform X1 n=1 Tax=Gastrolobium bilobum TaxID=150636 RepID=UPI002AB09EB2|nr:uncharacterized protein LOC133298823 isoform X1 [Gastrolobium bilobum]
MNSISQERIMRHQPEDEDPQLRVLYELCSIIIHTLKFPPLPFPFTTPYPYSSSDATASSSSDATASSSSMPPSKRQPWWTTLTPSQDSPATFASLFLGICLALMLFGSVTFFVGFLLLPWVILLVLVFYVAALVSYLSLLGRFILGSIMFHNNVPRALDLSSYR